MKIDLRKHAHVLVALLAVVFFTACSDDEGSNKPSSGSDSDSNSDAGTDSDDGVDTSDELDTDTIPDMPEDGCESMFDGFCVATEEECGDFISMEIGCPDNTPFCCMDMEGFEDGGVPPGK